MTVEADDPRLVFLPEDQVLSAKGLYQVLRDRWFITHPEKGLVFWQDNPRRKGQLEGSAPQCNNAKAVAEHFKEKMYPWAEIKQIPLVLLPINLKDYQ